ncbi:MAG TPA: signal recognition particle protein [Candidatus Syntrophosphaera sp.]|jgi:signal recognition particle subunit SRP54|nr:signal recognition particle protein [Candidatus Cloacimonadota bacterium]OQB91364.1 MAG: Signal recognition particle protein [Candidatus Cloacimonetes bacterium ADurb.Bin117]HNU54661.1 signal recognition particle protein [Candidatus Syntrophosphaera sp.]MDI9524913.1 signal recognition particle protein [Candidatus Cloacimonadota bacterium]NLH92624.1 signal recognition particle protein [Candidatus Cloacimonadota bacterium]
MFSNLSEKLDKVFRNIRGKGYLTEQNIKDALREIRLALLEADVNFRIVKNFVAEVEKRALGAEVMKSLTPGQQVIKIVHEQLIALMDTEGFELKAYNNKLTKIMLVGLQGSGKTTACAKLALHFRKKNIKPMMVACDVHRPAAIDQLQILGKQINIPVIAEDSKDVLRIADTALRQAQKDLINLLVFDTAGRLHIDEVMMDEVVRLKSFVKPDYIFFVADAMTGQEAVNVAKEFYDKLAFDAVILTKLDGDARGGAALSIKAVTERPVAFVGVGEKLNDLEVFHPDRMASRILGMGDVLSLIEKAEEAVDAKESEKLAKKMLKNQFTLNDFLKQLQSIKKMGSLESIIRMIPGLGHKLPADLKIDDNALKHVEAIIQSMTDRERERPDILNGSRRLRIAKGCGRSVMEVNRLLRQFEDMKKMMKKFSTPQGMKDFEKLMSK